MQVLSEKVGKVAKCGVQITGGKNRKPGVAAVRLWSKPWGQVTPIKVNFSCGQMPKVEELKEKGKVQNNTLKHKQI